MLETKSTSLRKSVTGPSGYPLVGVFPKMRRDPTAFLADIAREHGGIARLDFGLRQAYLVTHPDYVKYILQDNYRNYIRGASIQPARLLLGNGVATTDGDDWLRQRRLMQPAFHRQRVARFVTTIADIVSEVLDRWRSYARRGEPIDIAAEMMRLTLTVIVKTMFSTDITDNVQLLERSFNVAQAYIFTNGRRPLAAPAWLPTQANRRFRQALETLDAIIYGLIESRRRAPGARDDLLSMLLEAREEETGAGMSDRQLRDEVITIFFAGHETTATALAWTWYALIRHPDVDRRLRAELDEVLGGRRPGYEDLARLAYTGMVFQESMRLYPPIWMYAREAVEDDEIDGYPIPARTMILLSQYVTHHDPAFWPNPQAFDPLRFTPEQIVQRPRFAYYPFGGGPHLCIGNTFATMEAQIILAMVSQAFRMRLVPGHPIATAPQVTLRPRHGLLVTLQSVEESAYSWIPGPETE